MSDDQHKLLALVQKPGFNHIVTYAAGVATIVVCLIALYVTAELSITADFVVMGWAAWTATAVASAMAAFRLFAGPLTSGKDADRAAAAVARAWTTAFIAILVVANVARSVEQYRSYRQQRLCANAALMLKMEPAQLRALGLRCGSF